MSEHNYRTYNLGNLEPRTRAWLFTIFQWVTFHEQSSQPGEPVFADHWVLCYNTDEDHAVMVRHGAQFGGLFQGDDVLADALDQSHTYDWLWARSATVKEPERKPDARSSC